MQAASRGPRRKELETPIARDTKFKGGGGGAKINYTQKGVALSYADICVSASVVFIIQKPCIL